MVPVAHCRCGGWLISRWQLSVLTQKPSLISCCDRKKGCLSRGLTPGPAEPLPTQVSFPRVPSWVLLWVLLSVVIGKGLGTRIAFCYCSEQGHKCSPGVQRPFAFPDCRCPVLSHLPAIHRELLQAPASSVGATVWSLLCPPHQPVLSSCEEDTLFWPAWFSFLSLWFSFFLYSAMVTVGGTARLQKPQKRPPGSSHVPRGLWHPLVWLLRAAQPASPAGHFPRHSLFFSHMVKSHLGRVTFNGVRKIYTVEAQLQVGPSAFLPGG